MRKRSIKILYFLYFCSLFSMISVVYLQYLVVLSHGLCKCSDILLSVSVMDGKNGFLPFIISYQKCRKNKKTSCRTECGDVFIF